MWKRLSAIFIVLFILHYSANAFQIENQALDPPNSYGSDGVRFFLDQGKYWQDFFVNTFGLQNRPNRNANDNSAFLNHTTIVAHLVNGIYLQSGLINGKIPIDDLVGELFNFGSVSVSDILNFKSDKVTALANKLKSVRDSLDSKSDADVIEKQALIWDKWWQASQSLTNLKLDAIPNSAEYLKDVEKIGKFDFAAFNDGSENLNNVMEKIDAINKFLLKTNLKDHEYNEVNVHLTNLKIELDSLLKNAKTMKTKSSELDSFIWLKKGTEVYETLEKTIEAIKLRQQTILKPMDPLNVIEENMKKVMEPVADAKSLSSAITTIKTLTESGAHPQSKYIKHTTGFQNGISDLKLLVNTVRDPWIAKILNLEPSKLNGLSDGMQPLFKMSEKLDNLKDKLKPITSDDLYESLISFHEIQNDISKLSSDSTTHIGVLKDYGQCKPKPVGEDRYKEQLAFVQNVKSLENNIKELVRSLQDLDVENLQQKIEDFTKSIKFTDPNDPKKLKTELNKILDELKKTNKLEDLRKFTLDLKQRLFSIEANTIQSTGSSLATGDKTITDTNFKKTVADEIKVFECHKKLSQRADKVSSVIRVLQKLRMMSNKIIEDVGKVASVVSELSKSLSDIKSIPETLKKDAEEVTTELNKMDDVEKNYKSIGQTVRSLHYALALKELESSISGLKNAETVVQSEIQRISNPDERKTVIKQWGDHRKHVSELEKSIVTIKAFESKIDVSKAKTLGEYGDPLKEMTTFSDAQIGATEKVEALEFLISSATDPKVKSELEEIKKTLKFVSILDLGFANHKAHFQSAPGAFGAFNDFLTQFLTTEYNRINNDSNDSTLYIIIGVVIAVMIVVAAIFTAVKLKIRRKRKDRIAKFTHDLRSLSRREITKLCEIMARERGVQLPEIQNFSYNGRPIPFPGVYIDAGTHEFILIRTTDATIAQIFELCENVNINEFVTIGGGHPWFLGSTEPNDVIDDVFQVETRVPVYGQREISVTNTNNNRTLHTSEYRINNWDAGNPPQDGAQVIRIMKSLRSRRNTPIVVCARDYRLLMAFVALQYGINEVKRADGIVIQSIIAQMSSYFPDCFRNEDLIEWVWRSIVQMLNDN